MQLKKYFTFEVQVLDDKNVRRRFRASNYRVRPPTRCTGFAWPRLPGVGQHRRALPALSWWTLLLRAEHHACQAVHLHYAHAP